MHILTPSSIWLPLLSFASAIPQQSRPATTAVTADAPRPLPLLIWHGLGDHYDAEGLQSVGQLASQIHPGTEVYFIRLDEDGSKDRSATFFGNVSEQISLVCAAVLSNPALQDPSSSSPFPSVRADALGFSQGGQFLRGLVQRCDGLHVRSLVTFGSQHAGVAKIRECGVWDFVCKAAVALIKGNIWTDYVQGKVVPAQYFRTLNESTGRPDEEYLEHSNFLADVNNERVGKNEGYREKIAALERFVMYLFEEDTTVIPKESGWFADVNITSGEVTPLRETRAYQEDWLGLKALDERGGLAFKTNPGDHMQLDKDVLTQAFVDYFGPERKVGGKETGALDAMHDQVQQVLGDVHR